MNLLTTTSLTDLPIEEFLGSVGETFRVFADQDSGCVSYGVLVAGKPWFVKHSDEARGIESLRRAQHLHSVVSHPTLARLHQTIETERGLALVYDWVSGEVLYDYVRFPGSSGRSDPASPHVRFRSLPVGEILRSLDSVYDLHLLLAAQGFIAVDFYDGCILYDFDRHETHLCDLDEYRIGAFTLMEDRLPGSSRFMAPEEFQQGAPIDQSTNVFALARAAAVLLGDGTGSLDLWRGTDPLRQVVERATTRERSQRYGSVEEFVREWRSAVKFA